MKIKKRFTVTPEFLFNLEKKALSRPGIWSPWRLRYLVGIECALAAGLIFGAPVFLIACIAAVVWIADLWVARRGRRFKLSMEIALLRKYIAGESDHFYKDNKIAAVEREDIALFGKRSIRDVNPIHCTRKLIIRSIVRSGRFTGNTVVDVGCHYGTMSEEFLHGWRNVIGFDFQSMGMPEFRRRVGPHAVIGSAEHLPFKKGSLGAISFTEVLEHLLDPFAVLGELRNALVPGGKLLLSTDNRHEMLWEDLCNPLKILEKAAGLLYEPLLPVRSVLWRNADNSLYYYHTAFSKSEIRKVLEESGFVVEFQSSFPFLHTLYLLLNRLPFSVTEEGYARVASGLFRIYSRIPVIGSMGAHWLIIARKA